MANKPHPVRGYAFIAAATLLWGIAATLGRAAFTGRLLPSGQALKPIDPVILSQSRVTISFLVLLPVLMLRRGWRNLNLPAADFGRIVLIGILGMAASNYLYYLAIKRTNVATAIILQYTAPVLVLLYMVARGLQRATAQRVVAVLLSVAGSALAIGVVGASALRLDAVGVMAALLAAVSFAFYNIAGHRILSRYDRWIVLLYTTFSAGAFWLIVNPPWRLVAAHYSGSAVGISGGIRAGVGARSLLVLFRGTAASRANPRHRSQLPGTRALHPAGGLAAGRSPAAPCKHWES